MFKTSCVLTLAAGLALAASGLVAAPVNKCVIDGKVSYQQDPCPSGQPRRQPTVEELNADEKRKRAAAPVRTPAVQTVPASPTVPDKVAAPAPAPMPAPGFSCDGRTHCSQMKSCAEAKYFLANCPGVKMDGDRNGIPCEQQWCSAGPLHENDDAASDRRGRSKSRR